MKLRSSPASPFGRKTKIAAILCGIHLDVLPADTSNPEDTLRSQNPLGKIPILLPDEGAPVYDSRVIVEYLDAQAGGGCIIPRSGPARFEALTAQALADGLMDAALLQVYEGRFRSEEQFSASWIDRQAGKVARALHAFEAAPPRPAEGVTGAAHVGEITLACALGYLDFRFKGMWREDHSALVAWLDSFAARVPAFEATHPAD